MSKLAKALTAAAGNAGGDNLYVEDVFSTYLFVANGATGQTITNGIDLSTEGGMVWHKDREVTYQHVIWDTERGTDVLIRPDSTGANESHPSSITYNTNGYDVNGAQGNENTDDTVSWTFRKAEKFFDVVTYTGNGVAGREIAHNLGSVPACIIIKETTISGQNWVVYHSGVGATHWLALNNADASTDDNRYFQDTEPTSSVFTVGNINAVNGTLPSTREYVAYLFASDAGGFGDDGSESIIKCGSYTGGSSGLEINLGFEPQWIMIKRTNATDDWVMYDVMRGMPVGGDSAELIANANYSENGDFGSSQPDIHPNPTGFTLQGTSSPYNNSGSTYIYIAIRRPMKTPTAGTEVFALQDPGYPVDSNGLAFTSGFPVDFALLKERTNSTDGWYTMSRMQGDGNYMKTNSNAAETSGVTYGTFDHNTGWYSTASASMSWMFKRATGFFDVVAYTGTGSAHAEDHNLGVTPELLIVKNRSSVRNWFVWVDGFGSTDYLELNLTSAKLTGANIWNSTTPTASQFSVGGVNNTSGNNFIAYLFASVAGVSKVGSYTGNGGAQTIDCGFANGARFILIKRTNTTGNWMVFDSVRGIIAGSDPYLELNTTDAEVTFGDYVAPNSTGFNVSSFTNPPENNVNANGDTYIFLAIA